MVGDGVVVVLGLVLVRDGVGLGREPRHDEVEDLAEGVDGQVGRVSVRVGRLSTWFGRARRRGPGV